jgi:glycosyltransferase involved in cell wall biosynthesis
MDGESQLIGVDTMSEQRQARPAILFFGNDWYAENRTSSHQIARWLARRCRVYYIECPGLRAPKGSRRDFKKLWTKLTRALRRPKPDQAGLHVKTLFQLPFHRFGFVRWLNRVLMVRILRRLIKRENLANPVLWFMLPHVCSVLGQLGEALSVYYCIDDYAALPDVNERAIGRMDELMTRNSSLVFVSSETLLEQKRRLNPNTQVSPHGVDLDHFIQAQSEDVPAPAETAGLPHPIIGFFGLLERWIDLDLIDYLAEKRPSWTFLLIGRVAVSENEVPRRPNIHFIGKRPYEQLPAYGKQFDAAIIPYRLTRQVMHANPIKLREYLAMGKAVVSVATPEISKYADVVCVTHTREEFLAALDEVIARQCSAEQIRRRIERVRSESWDCRLQQVLDVVDRKLGCARFSKLSEGLETNGAAPAFSPVQIPAVFHS